MTDTAVDTEAVRHLARQAAAGARLFYAIYHHPDGPEFIKTACKSYGFTTAYVAATEVFIPREQQWPEGDVHFNPRPDEEDDAP